MTADVCLEPDSINIDKSKTRFFGLKFFWPGPRFLDFRQFGTGELTAIWVRRSLIKIAKNHNQTTNIWKFTIRK